MIFYTTGVSIAGFSTNIDFMLIARGFQGVGLSMFPIAFSIVRAQFPREKIAIGQGIITSMYGGGAVIGLSIGGTIIQNYSWHATFFTIIPIAIVLLFLIRRFIPADKEEVEQTRIPLQKEQKVQQQQRQQETEPEEGKSNSEFIKGKTTITKSRKSVASETKIDIKGAITLTVAITSFLLVLTYLEMGSGNNNNNNNNNNPIDSSSTIAIASFLLQELFQ